MNKNSSRYVEPQLSDARVARLWDGVAGRLSVPPSAAGRRLRRGAVAGVLVAALAAGALFIGDRGSEPSAWENAALQTAGDMLSVSLRDGSWIQLAAHTRVEVAEKSERAVQLHLKQGRVSCDVIPEQKRRFVVLAGPVRVQVTGTRFSVDLGPRGERVEVRVERGSVEVSSQNEPGRPRQLHAGEHWSADLAAPGEVSTAPEPPPHDPAQAVGPAAPDAPAAGDAAPATPPSAAPALEAASARALLDRANSARRAGDMTAAARAYEELLARYPNDGRAGLAAFELGRLRMDRLGNLPGAVQALQRAISLAPGSGFREDAMARLVQAYEALGNRERCREARQAYLRTYPSGVHAARVTGQCGLR